jgi:hypothetical protein
MKRILLLTIGAAVLLSVSFAFGQNTTVQFTGATYGNNWNGFGTGFYSGTFNGVAAVPGMICDDYYDHISSGDTWTANGVQVSTLNAGNIGNTLFGADNGFGVAGYQQLAYLTNYMFSSGVGNGALQSSISQALWYLTSNAVMGAGSGIALSSLDAQAQSLISYVQTHTLPSLSTYTNLWLYTAAPPTTESQEMWGHVPEGGAALTYLLLAGVICLGAMFYSRRQTSMSGLA